MRTHTVGVLDMFVVRLCLLFLLSTIPSTSTIADTGQLNFPNNVPLSTVQKILPGAETIGPSSGRPAAARVYGESDLEGFLSTVGYVFSVGDLLHTAGYTGEPFEIISAMDVEGIITGAILVRHREPILGTTSKAPGLEETVASFSGLDVLDPGPLDFGMYADNQDSSALIMLEAVYLAGRSVAVSRELRGPGEREGRRLILESYRPLNWEKLLNMGAVRGVTLSDTDIFSFLASGSNRADANAPEILKDNALLEWDSISYDEEMREVTATGDVEISIEDSTLLAEQVTYNRELDLVSAVGNVVFMSPDGSVTFLEAMELTGDFKRGTIEAISYDVELNYSGSANKVYVSLATPALIGRNLLDNKEYEGFEREEGANIASAQIWLGVAHGPISIEMASALAEDHEAQLGLGLRQGGWVGSIDSSIVKEVRSPAVSDISRAWLIGFKETGSFDPAQPWSMEIKTLGDAKNRNVLSIPYSPPQEIVWEPIPHQIAVDHRKQETVVPLWVTVWIEQKYALGIMFISFFVLSVILILQGSIVRSPKMLKAIKFGFLLFTLSWLGWYAGAQVSIMHVLSLVRAPVLEWNLESLLLDPLILGVLGFTLVGTLLLGRGVFCGWLCPFGALQDLLSQLAKWLHIRQLSVPASVNRRLWSLKYFVLIGLLSVTFASPTYLHQAVEVEPFSTAILYQFVRSWPYTLFALMILGSSLFVERSFCRYLCPLGACLAVVGRIRVLEWLKRRPECGKCNICSDLCPVQAIGADGEINFSECYQCLKCQVAYCDNMVCPPLIQRRERRERLGVV